MNIRPLKVQDAAAFRAFVERLSPASRYARFQYVVKEVTPELLRLLLVADPRSHVALAAFDGDEIVGEARYVRQGEGAEFAIAVADDRRGQGFGRQLFDRLVRTARSQGLRHLDGEVLASNSAMIAFVTQAGFSVSPHLEDALLVQAHKQLRSPAYSRSADTARFAIGAGFG